MANNIELYEKMTNSDPFQAIAALAGFCVKSGMLGVKNEAQASLMAVACLSQGITPFEFHAIYHVIDFKGTQQLCIRSEVLQARFLESGGRIEWLKYDDEECEANFIHPQHCPNGFKLKITMEKMKERGIATFMYDKFPRQMLKARVISEGVRLINPSLTNGYYVAEELAEEKDSVAPGVQVHKRRPRSTPSPVEPREIPVTVTDDAPPSQPAPAPATPPEPPPEIDLADIEDDANAYIKSLNWISGDKTWRDVAPDQTARIAKGMIAFREQVAAYKEKSNV